jgi:hypothetical protein
MDHHGQQQAHRVYHNVACDPELLVRVEAALPTFTAFFTNCQSVIATLGPGYSTPAKRFCYLLFA